MAPGLLPAASEQRPSPQARSASWRLAAALCPPSRAQSGLRLGAARAQSPSSHRARSAARSVYRTLAGAPNPEGSWGGLAPFRESDGEVAPDQDIQVPRPRASILGKGLGCGRASHQRPKEVEDPWGRHRCGAHRRRSQELSGHAQAGSRERPEDAPADSREHAEGRHPGSGQSRSHQRDARCRQQ